MLLSLATVNSYVLYDGFVDTQIWALWLNVSVESLIIWIMLRPVGLLFVIIVGFLLLTANYNGRRLFSRKINMGENIQKYFKYCLI